MPQPVREWSPRSVATPTDMRNQQEGERAGNDRRHDRDGACAGRSRGIARPGRRQWTRRRAPIRQRGGIVVEHLAFELAQLLAGLEPELRAQHRVRVGVDAERLSLPRAGVQGPHQLRPQPLAQRMLRDKRLQLRAELGVPAERQFRVNARLDRSQAKLLEPLHFQAREQLEFEIRQWRTPPQLLRLT